MGSGIMLAAGKKAQPKGLQPKSCLPVERSRQDADTGRGGAGCRGKVWLGEGM